MFAAKPSIIQIIGWLGEKVQESMCPSPMDRLDANCLSGWVATPCQLLIDRLGSFLFSAVLHAEGNLGVLRFLALVKNAH